MMANIEVRHGEGLPQAGPVLLAPEPELCRVR
jgi:hypothetical protein